MSVSFKHTLSHSLPLPHTPTPTPTLPLPHTTHSHTHHTHTHTHTWIRTCWNSSNDMRPSPSLSASRSVLSTTCWSWGSESVAPVIILRIWNSSAFEQYPSLSISYTLKQTVRVVSRKKRKGRGRRGRKKKMKGRKEGRRGRGKG